jgi:hypothetical protein
MHGIYHHKGKYLKCNNYARYLLNELLTSTNDLNKLLEAVTEMAKEDLPYLCSLIGYSAYCGGRYEKRKAIKCDMSDFVGIDEEIYSVYLLSEGVSLKIPEKGNGETTGKITNEDLYSYAFGEIGLTPYEFNCMTFAEYALTISGYFERRWRSDQQTREIVYNIIKFSPNRRGNMPSIEKFWKLPTDKKTSTFDAEQIKEKWKRINKAR